MKMVTKEKTPKKTESLLIAAQNNAIKINYTNEKNQL